jgi:hypothetical protein
MNDRPTTLERAYQLARTGSCKGVGDIRAQLKREGFPDIPGQLYGPTLARALNRLCQAANGLAPDPAPGS